MAGDYGDTVLTNKLSRYYYYYHHHHHHHHHYYYYYYYYRHRFSNFCGCAASSSLSLLLFCLPPGFPLPPATAKGPGERLTPPPQRVRAEPDRQTILSKFWAEKVPLMTAILVAVHEITSIKPPTKARQATIARTRNCISICTSAENPNVSKWRKSKMKSDFDVCSA